MGNTVRQRDKEDRERELDRKNEDECQLRNHTRKLNTE